MTTTTIKIESLTKSQIETYNSLVKLGDSKELALKTVLEMKPVSKEAYAAYYNAYNN